MSRGTPICKVCLEKDGRCGMTTEWPQNNLEASHVNSTPHEPLNPDPNIFSVFGCAWLCQQSWCRGEDSRRPQNAFSRKPPGKLTSNSVERYSSYPPYIQTIFVLKILDFCILITLFFSFINMRNLGPKFQNTTANFVSKCSLW